MSTNCSKAHLMCRLGNKCEEIILFVKFWSQFPVSLNCSLEKQLFIQVERKAYLPFYHTLE